MVKPIFIIKLPKGTNIKDVRESIKDALPDYHTLITEGTNNPDIEFQCFYEKDMTDIKFEELKDYIKQLK